MQTLPVLPLRDIVVFPQMIVPLFVGRDKSVKALEVGDRVRRIDYLCHFGARLGRRVPSESTQASSSACVACSPFVS